VEKLINEALAMLQAGASISSIKKFLNLHRSDIANELLAEVAKRAGITSEELESSTGESFGKTREQRPKATFDIMAASLLGLMLLFRRDTAKVRKELRVNSTVAGVKTGKKFHKKYLALPTQKAKDKLLNKRLGDILNGAFRVKLFRRSGMFSKRYIVTETSSVVNVVKLKIAKVTGKKVMFIPETSHGHSDNCAPFEGRYWAIDSGVKLPPYHVNCQHIVKYMRELPKGEKITEKVPNDTKK
jgi:hypothetical protein